LRRSQTKRYALLTLLLILALTNPIEASASAGPAVPDPEPIVKDYRWHDQQGREWTWKVPISAEMYRYYRNQPRIHERVLNEYVEQLRNLKQQTAELQRYTEFWYRQCKIQPGDSYHTALQKYQTYMSAYRKAQRNLSRIQIEYLKLQQSYQTAAYRQMLDGYVPYVAENSELVRSLAEAIAEKAPRTPRGEIEFAACFVQEAIPYRSEKGEYPRYPVETLVDGGDCEDKSVLLAAVLRAMGYRTALLLFNDNPGHMAVGVECAGCPGSYYQKDGVNYFYLESTHPGWSVGEIPPEFQKKGALVYVIP